MSDPAPRPPTDPALDPGLEYETEAQTGAFADTASYAEARRPTPRRSLLVQAIYDTFSQTGARLAAIWIGLLITLAVFAPFIASSFPITMVVGGERRFPLIGSLSPVDILLLVTFLAAVTMLLLRRSRFSTALLVLLAVNVVTAPIAYFLFEPPENIVYQEFRDLEASGAATEVVRTIIPYSANDRLRDVGNTILQPPDARHWMGTTAYGEDVLSRMIHATRVALAIGFIATGISVVIGVLIGAVMGYFSGTIDLIGMRFIEIVEAIPRLILLLIIMVSFGRNIYYMMIAIGFVSWTSHARFIRAEYLKLRKQDFVQAAQAAGLPLRNILFRHMLPNGIAPVLVNVSFGIGAAILSESVLSFLGLGLLPEDPSWGQLLNQARQGGGGFNWWIATYPGGAIFLTVFSFILIGEAMRDAIDPKLKKAGE